MALALSLAELAHGQFITVEPDNFPEGTILNTLTPGVSLITAGRDNLPHPPAPFNVTATTDNFGFAPTGTRVFGHVNIPFWNTDRRLRMDFDGFVSTVSIAFAGGNGLSPERGRLEVYGVGNTLLDIYLTSFRLGGDVETMSISRATPDIAFAVAYVAENEGSFGRLDALRFTTPVPEPSTWALCSLGLMLLGLRWWRKYRAESGFLNR
jgi:hypothetical protein